MTYGAKQAAKYKAGKLKGVVWIEFITAMLAATGSLQELTDWLAYITPILDAMDPAVKP